MYTDILIARRQCNWILLSVVLPVPATPLCIAHNHVTYLEYILRKQTVIEVFIVYVTHIFDKVERHLVLFKLPQNLDHQLATFIVVM